jgi:dihydrofolate synthase / folylpolyglutamate synthase
MFLSYSDTLSFLYDQLPVFQHQGNSAYKKDLTNTLLLAEALGNPEKGFRSIHVGGTNGKGSVSSMLSAVFTLHGKKTGLYTSPHLKDFRERIRIDGQMIPEQTVVDFVNMSRDLIDRIRPSFFELTAAMAFYWFNEQQVDMAIIEVGMGGRLDSTNVINPELAIITNIAWDHAELLGGSLEKIAFEKAGIIKPGVPCVIGEWDEVSGPIFEQVAITKDAPISIASRNPAWWGRKFSGALKGSYQQKNMRTVWEAISVLQTIGYDLDSTLVQDALNRTSELSGLRGRWEILKSSGPIVVADTAHNDAGMRIVLEQLRELPMHRLHMVFGVVQEKDLSKILPLMPKDAIYYFCKPNVVRGLDAVTLKETASAYGLTGNTYNSASEAYESALEAADTRDVIFVGGSTFVVAEII